MRRSSDEHSIHIKPEMIRLLQYNIQSIIPNKHQLIFFLQNKQIDIALLSETFKCDDSFKLPNYNIVYKNRDDNYGGVAIILKKNIKFRKIKYQSNQDIVIIETTNLTPNIIVTSLYIPPSVNQSTFESEFRKLLQFLDPHDNVLVGGDFNARSKLLGDSVDHPRGVKMMQTLDDFNFSILNDGSPTFHRFIDKTTHASVLDVTFSNFSTPLTWKTIDNPISGSHHKPIIIELLTKSTIDNIFVNKKQITATLSKISLPESIEEINKTITNIVEKCSYKIKNRKPKSYWDESVNRVYRKYLAAFQKCRKFTNPANIREYYLAKEEWTQKLRAAKNENWNKKIEELNKNGGTKECWRFIKNVKNCQDPTFQRPNWTFNQQNDYLQMLNSHTSKLQKSNESLLSGLNNFKHNPFSIEELKFVLDEKTVSTAAGHDKIKYFMIKCLSTLSKKKVLDGLNKAWSSCDILDIWRTIDIIPIPKKIKI